MVDVGFHVANSSTFRATPAPSVPLFDSYVVVDWSGASSPRLGKDSIWYCVVDRHNGSPLLGDSYHGDGEPNKPKKKVKGGSEGRSPGTPSYPNRTSNLERGSKSIAEACHDTNYRVRCIENVATREAATVCLRDLLNGFLTECPPRRTLFGWDFSFGFPQGFADALGLHDSISRNCLDASPLGRCTELEGDSGGIGSQAGREMGDDWQLVWEYVDGIIQDAPSNANNRFTAAAEMNKKVRAA